MFKQNIEILSHDEEYNTIFARGVSGSITLDIIPAALAHMKAYPQFDKMYLQDFTGVEFIITQESTIESAIEDWQNAQDLKRGTFLFPQNKTEQAVAQIQPQNG